MHRHFSSVSTKAAETPAATQGRRLFIQIQAQIKNAAFFISSVACKCLSVKGKKLPCFNMLCATINVKFNVR